MKNILLTTLGYTQDMIDVKYFHFRKPNGEKCYCTGISTAEAGTKYILSSYQIDEIIVLGAPGVLKPSDITEPMALMDFSIEGKNSLEDFSEYSFYCYRIQQFLDGLDIEGNDIYEIISPEEQAYTTAAFRELLESKLQGVRQKDLFDILDSGDCSETEMNELREKLTNKQWKWLVYSIYGHMDSYYKMHALNKNRQISVRYFEISKDLSGTIDYERFGSVASSIMREEKDGVTLYMDLQGLDFSDAFALFNLISVIRKSSRINIEGIIESTMRTSRLSAPILDELNRMDIHDLRTGVSIFARYGKMDYLRNYLRNYSMNNPEIDRLLLGMQYVEEGASLCNIEVLKYGMNVIRQLFAEDNPDKSTNLKYKVLARTLQMEYGKLLKGDDVDIVELLRWSINNQMYQQALTILESQIPKDMVRHGIFYYAQTKEDIDRLMEELNVDYWNEIPKNRYIFRDIEHHFVKSYGRKKINFRQKPDMVNRDYAKLRILQLHGHEDILPAYSNLNNDDMLYELLLSYYNISNLRNAICHAEPPETAFQGGAELVPTSNLDVLKTAIARFINIYSAALKKVNKDMCEPLLVDDEGFKQYRYEHRLVPFSATDENVLKNSCQFNFNGKEVSILVKMLEPQDDVY